MTYPNHYAAPHHSTPTSALGPEPVRPKSSATSFLTTSYSSSCQHHFSAPYTYRAVLTHPESVHPLFPLIQTTCGQIIWGSELKFSSWGIILSCSWPQVALRQIWFTVSTCSTLKGVILNNFNRWLLTSTKMVTKILAWIRLKKNKIIYPFI